jgi:hypothetical protein
MKLLNYNLIHVMRSKLNFTKENIFSKKMEILDQFIFKTISFLKQNKVRFKKRIKPVQIIYAKKHLVLAIYLI